MPTLVGVRCCCRDVVDLSERARAKRRRRIKDELKGSIEKEVCGQIMELPTTRCAVGDIPQGGRQRGGEEGGREQMLTSELV